MNSCSDLEKYYLALPYGLSDFTIGFWTSPDLSRETKLRMLKEPLEGLRTLHAMGIMHRDVRPSNTLILSFDPPQTAICDYGKAIEAESSTVTTIGPICTLAPEVWTVDTDGPYTHKIDLWAYGYAIAEILGYSVQKYPGATGFHGDKNPQITRDRYAAILAMLLAHGEETPEDRPLVDLASKLLSWKSQDRWSAAQALKHKCWDPITQEQVVPSKDVAGHKTGLEDSMEGSKSKRPRPDETRAPAPVTLAEKNTERKAASYPDKTQAFSDDFWRVIQE